MVYTFISYSRKDVEFTKKFAADLENVSIRFWRDENEIPPWEDWDKEIRKALSRGDITHLIYLHSKHSVDSEIVQAEIEFARDKKIKLVVVRLDKSDRPLIVYKKTYFDFFVDYEREFNKLVTWIKKPVEEKTEQKVELVLDGRILEPTTDQRIAAQNDQNKKVKIVAGPGTGKSFVIEERVRWLLEKGVNPETIFVVSFTRSASSDLRRRIVTYCNNKSQPGSHKVNVSTLHSMALKALKKNNNLSSYPVEPVVLGGWEVTETFDAEFNYEHGGVIAKNSSGKRVKKRSEEIRRYHEALWYTQLDDLPQHQPKVQITDDEKIAFEQFRRVFSRTYSAVLPGELIAECMNKIDVGILNPVELLGIKHFLVDEFQDLNYADNLFVEAISSDAHIISTYILGDDDQSIYAFRLAYPQGIIDFETDITHTLSECFRCTPVILQTATNFIQANSTNTRLHKDIVPHYKDVPSVVRRHEFFSDVREANFIARSCKRLLEKNVAPENILILISSRDTQLDALVNAFDKAQVSVDTPPQQEKLYTEGVWVKYLIAILRVACDLDLTDYIAHRLVLGYQAGVGVGTCSKIKNKVFDNGLNYLKIFYHKLPERIFSTREKTAIEKAKQVFEKLTRWMSEDTISIRVKEITELITENYSSDELLDSYIDVWEELVERLPDEMTIYELMIYLSATHRSQAVNILKSVYERLGLDPETSGINLDPRIEIKTMHSAKGLNAQVVFIPGLEQAIIPGVRVREKQGLVYEKARMLYVAITRASVACFMTYSKSRTVTMPKDFGRRGSDFFSDLGGRVDNEIEVISEQDVDQIMESISRTTLNHDNG